jgi:hypothetical protein
MHTHSVANGRCFLPFINSDSLDMAGPTHEFKGAVRFRYRMPFYQNKPPTLTKSALLKNPGAVIATDVLKKDMDYFESTYHHTFTFDLGNLADTCGNLRNVYIYNNRVTVLIWKTDKQLINRPEITEDSFKIGKSAFK